MPKVLKIILNSEEDRTLKELSCADGVARRTKERAIALRLNAHGWNVSQIAEYLGWAQQTVRQTIQLAISGVRRFVGSARTWKKKNLA